MFDRVPVILQTEVAECGLACLAMVARAHGYHTDLQSLRRQFQISLRGVNLKTLTRIAEGMGFDHRPLRLELEGLKQLKLPAVLHWDMDHFVVLVSQRRNRYVVHDPARGKRILTREEMSRHFTGIALELSPSKAFQKKTERAKLDLWSLWRNAEGLKRTLAQVLVLAFVLELLLILSPLFLQIVVDQVVVSADRDLLTVVGVGFLLFAILQAGVTLLRGWAITHLSTHLNLQLITNLFTHLLKLPLAFFERRHIGDLVSRFGSIEFIQRTMTTGFLETFVDGVFVVATFLMMLLYSPKLALVALIAALLYGVLRWIFYSPLRIATDEQLVHAARQNTHFIETLRGIQAVKLFNAQAARKAVWQNAVVDNFNAQIRVQHLNVGMKAGNTLLFCVENVIVVWLGAILVMQREFSLGMLYAFLAYKLQFVSRIGALIDKAIEFRMLSLHAERIAEIALAEPEAKALGVSPATQGTESIEPSLNLSALMNPRTQPNLPDTSLEIRNLSYRHAAHEPWVFQGLNFRVPAGSSLVLVGPSGVGKTTLMKVLLGLLLPTEGEVLAGGVPTTQIGSVAWRECVGAVMQDDQLFMGTLADNIAFFDPEFDQAWTEECAKRAEIHDDVLKMPMGYNTLIGNMGSNLSGGQRQRILLARALYRRPRFLFLDEATSQLDAEREKSINEAVRGLGITTVIAAHREETIRTAEHVFTLRPVNALPTPT